MSSGKTHKLVFVSVVAIAVGYLYFTGTAIDAPTLAVTVLFGVVAAVWPDIDIATSPASRWLKVLLVGLTAAALVAYQLDGDSLHLAMAAVFAGIFLALHTAHHRRFCHSLVFLGLMTAGAYFLAKLLGLDPRICALGWFTGQSLHLISDRELTDGWLT